MIAQKLCKIAAVSLLAIGMAGCGGGGGSKDEQPQNPQPQSFTVTSQARSGGSVSPASQSVVSGNTATFTVTTEPGYAINSVSGCGGTLAGSSYTTGTITSNCTVTAEFAEIDDTAPTARILFPWKQSYSTDSEMVVRGVATAGNLKSIRVNGVEATLSAPAASGAIRSMTPMAMGAPEGEITWTATVPVEGSGDSSITIALEDMAGRIVPAVDSVEVLKRRVPSWFAIDSENRRLVGQARSGHLASYSLDSDEYQVTDLESDTLCGALAHRPGSDRVVCAELIDDKLELTEFTVGSSESYSLYEYDLNLDPESWLFAHVREVEFSSDGGSLYVLLKVFSAIEYSQTKSVILRYDYSSGGAEVVVDGETSTGDAVTTDRFAYTDQGFLIFDSFWGGEFDNLHLLGLSGEESMSVSTIEDMSLHGIDVNEQQDIAYLAGYEGIVKVALGDGASEVISLESEEDTFNISQIRSTGLDEANNRLLIADSGFDYILSVDLETGERSEFAANGIGEGKRLAGARAIALNEEDGVAYLLDETSGGLLVRVDLGTGDREVVARFGLEYSSFATELLLDSDRQNIYAVFTQEVFRVGLADVHSVIRIDNRSCESECAQSAPSFSGAALDEENNRLLITDSRADALLEMDLATGVVNTLTASSEHFRAVMDVALDRDNGIAYMLSQATGDLYAYDLANDEFALMSGICWGGSDNDGVQSIYLDAVRQNLWVAGHYLSKYELDTGVCDVMPPGGLVPLDMVMTDQGQLLGVRSQQMIQLDFESGRQVVISK